MGQVTDRLAALGITLPTAPAPVGAYVGWTRTGSLIATSGQLPFVDGVIAVAGKLGDTVTIEEGTRAARLAAINAISQLAAATGDLDRIARVVRMDGLVHSAAGFQQQPIVLNGASEVLYDIFGEAGQHARVAIPVPEMPLNAAVQIALWAEVRA